MIHIQAFSTRERASMFMFAMKIIIFLRILFYVKLTKCWNGGRGYLWKQLLNSSVIDPWARGTPWRKKQVLIFVYRIWDDQPNDNGLVGKFLWQNQNTDKLQDCTNLQKRCRVHHEKSIEAISNNWVSWIPRCLPYIPILIVGKKLKWKWNNRKFKSGMNVKTF